MADFHLSTKVGFFPSHSGGSVHSLDPARLQDAARQSAEDLGRIPNVLLLHNPEHSLRRLALPVARERLAGAYSALASCVEEGLCASWGISSWDPRPIVQYWTDGQRPPALPAVIMCRAGLLTSAAVLDAAAELGDACHLDRSHRWGMSPFGGNASDRVWNSVDARIFLRAGQEFARTQAAFRVAYELPDVGHVAVGTSDPAHLRQLVSALALETDPAAISRYRSLLAARQAVA